MSISDDKVEKEAGVAVLLIPFNVDGVPASQSDVEFRSVRLPDNTDWELVEAFMHCRAVSGTVQAFLSDDGLSITTQATDLVAGVQTLMPLTPDRSHLKGGSELQLFFNSGAGESADDITVTCYVRPLYIRSQRSTPAPA